MVTKQQQINGLRYAKATGEGFKYNCLHHYKGEAYSIALDWLQYCAKLRIDKMPLGSDFKLNDWRWLHQGHGTQHYIHLYHVYSANHHCFTVQISPKRSKDKSLSIIKLENWLLYSDWYTYNNDFLTCFSDEVVRLSRVDVAIDGLNYMRKLVHETRIAVNHERSYKMIGKSTVNASKFNRISGLPNGIKIGSSKGQKIISIYNKSKELEKGNKPYIQDYWRKNKLPTDKEVDRFECRMMSGFLGRVLDEKGEKMSAIELMDNLLKPAFQLGLVNLFCNNFFEFIYKDDSNVSRCTRVNIIPQKVSDMAISQLEKKPTNYKSKLTIHNLYQQVCMEKVNPEDAIQVMKRQLEYHGLYDWYRCRLREFDKLYVCKDGELKTRLHDLVFTAEKEQKYQAQGELINRLQRNMDRLQFNNKSKRVNK